MEVKWLIIARDYEWITIDSKTTSVNIYEVLDILTFDHQPPFDTKVIAIANVHTEPNDVDKVVNVRFQVTEKGKAPIGYTDLPFSGPTLSQWANKNIMFTCEFDTLHLERVGEYCFEVYIEDELKASEWLVVDIENGGVYG